MVKFPGGSYIKREFFRLLRMPPVSTEQVVAHLLHLQVRDQTLLYAA